MTASSWRVVPALVTALVLVGGAVGPVASADTAQPCASTADVAVHLPDGSVQTLTAAALCDEADVFATQYFSRSPHQPQQPTPYIQQGTSIRALLEGLQPPVDPGAVQFVAVPDDVSGTWSTLSAADLADPDDFTNGLLPVLRVNGNLIDYYRPLRSASDANAGDAAQTAAGGTLEIDVHTGPMLSVSASSDRAAARLHQAVRFSAAVQDPPAASRPLVYSWTFGDGSTGTGARVSHAFTATGTYLAQVTVSGADDAGGVSNQIQETVGAPRSTLPGGQHAGTGSKPRRHAPSSGPVDSQGHRTGATPHRHASAGNAGTGGSTETTDPGGGLTVPPIHNPSQVGGSRGQSPDLALNRPPVVHGQLVTDGAGLSAQQVQAATTAASATASGAGTTDRTNLWTAVGAAAAVVALLLLGAGRERRRPRSHTSRQGQP